MTAHLDRAAGLSDTGGMNDAEIQEEQAVYELITEAALRVAALYGEGQIFTRTEEILHHVIEHIRPGHLNQLAAQRRPAPPPGRRPLPAAVRVAVFERDAYRCRRCGGWTDLTADHVIPVAAGGTDDLDNLQTLCRPCNSRKGSTVDEGGP